uniref:Brain tumor protein n=1 Tax=Magallana gigas TaxID=29159 RepID=K1PGT2_MAGGI
MLKKAQRLKDRLHNGFGGFNFKHRCSKQRRYCYSTERYELRYEQSAINPVQFLREKSHIPQICDSPHLTIHTNHLSINNAINTKDVLESLIDIKMRDGEKRHFKNERLLKLMTGVELHQSLSVKDARHCDHISCVTSDRVWISYRDHLMLINTKGDTLYSLNKLSNYSDGFHTVNKENELIFIGNGCITKLSRDMKTATTFIETKDSPWRPRCVYCSPSTGDLLVGVYRYLEEKETGKVTRYNQIGKLTQTVFTDNTGNNLYKSQRYITENNNGDVVVSDINIGVVVTDCVGRHCFSYTGHPPEIGLIPYGICTDVLSHILVCDGKANTVQMIDRDDAKWQYVKWPFSTTNQTSTWRPRCVCWSPFTGDLLVGMYIEEPNIGKVTRYNQSGELAQTIQYNDNELELYRGPRFITENNNGDIVVCDDDALVVTDRDGRHRFSYTGHPLGSGLLPGGICTNALSHIFVCDSISKTVHMIDKDGQFLLHVMEPQEEDEPCSLGYDVHTQSLWVGTLYNNTLSIYTFSDQDTVTNELPPSPGEDVLIGAGSV